MKNAKFITVTIVLLFLVGGGSFFAGIKYQQGQRSSALRQFGGQPGLRAGNGSGRMGFRPVSGEIISADENSITVKLTDDSSKIILLSDKTSINKATDGLKSDLKVGEKVAVFGTENPDGSLSAQSIQLNPVLRETSGNPHPTGATQ